ncbi:hypothetical protein [Streptomyces boluensis]|uniref:Lipoprotein n=1 Tax=Streptomyces boluensis TaxID=1775135 RepID=A0A964URJ8_9ACTN|nr:hypothetical protein [Streptomyces boluensis]NBE54064.1 hypothetical protein [Streptomyces boluensis]
MPKTRKATFSTLGVTLCATALTVGLTSTAFAADDNGIADKSVDEISKASRAALDGVSSLHVEAEIKGMAEPAPAAFELSYDTKGNCTGTVTNQRNKGSMEVLRQGDRVWIKPDAKWLESEMPELKGDAAAELVKGKYFETSTKDANGAKIAELCDLNGFKQQIRDRAGEAQKATVTKGERTEVDGRPAIELKVKKGTQEGSSFVATEGKPYPLKVEADDSADGVEVEMTFSEFDKPVTVKTPPADQTVDIN